MAQLLKALHFAVCACTEKDLQSVICLEILQSERCKVDCVESEFVHVGGKKTLPICCRCRCECLLLLNTCNLQVYICRVARALVDEDEQCAHMFI